MTHFEELIEEIETLQLAKALPDEGDDLTAPDESPAFEIDHNGETYEVVDGHALMKALSTRLDAQQAEQSSQQADLLKAMTGLMQLIKTQNTAIQALQTDVMTLRATGKGPQSVLTAPAVPSESFMAKALKLSANGQLNPADVSVLELAGFQEAQVPRSLANKINTL